MISNILLENIYNFIERIGVVEEEQIKLMFGVQHKLDAIDFNIRHLVRESRINRDSETGHLIRRHHVNPSDMRQKFLTECAWVLAYMGENKVRDYCVCEYPVQLLIITEDNVVYDFTMFTYSTLDSVKMYVPIKRKLQLPEGVEDNIVHVAIVPDKELADEISKLEFDSYCILGEHKKPKYYEWKVNQ